MPRKKRESKPLKIGAFVLDPEHISRTVTTRRSEKEFSIREFARRSGVSLMTAQRFDSGNYRVQLDNFLRMIAVLDLDPADLIQRADRTMNIALSPQEADLLKLLRSGPGQVLLERLVELINET